MPAICRVGDTGSHGGSITSGSPTIKANSLPVARHGDSYDCAEHGMQTLISTNIETAENKPIVTVGCEATCGSVMTSGSTNVNIGD